VIANTFDVLSGRARWSCEAADALSWLERLPTASASLVIFSPPYESARTYGIGVKLRGQAWVDWLRPIVVEAARVSEGLVVVNAAGQVRDGSYSPVVELLTADLVRLDGLVVGPSPYAWVRNGIPGSGNKRYQRRNWEPVYCYCLPDRLPLTWTDNTAFGHAPKFGPGGEMSNRTSEGGRVNQWGGRVTEGGTRQATGRRQPKARPSHWIAPTGIAGGDMATRKTTPPAIANPGNVIRTGNGGNQLGHVLAHENEAPMNLALAERFVRWFAPPDSVVCDPFAGSGTSAHAAIRHGRRFVGCDIRDSQVELLGRRMADVERGISDE
jgi:hypothetical protein